MSDENSGGNTNENSEVNANVGVKADERVQKLEIVGTIKEGVEISIKNIGPVLVNLILWVLTIWIPYLNVGTTIGLYSGIVAKLSRGENILYTEIFDPKYRKYMGEYFLTAGLLFIGVLIGVFFFIVPGIIISIAWGFSLILVVDKGKNPTEALTLSNNITYGYKGRIFLISVIISVVFSVIQAIFNKLDNGLGVFLILVLVIFELLVSLGIQASMYKQLMSDK